MMPPQLESPFPSLSMVAEVRDAGEAVRSAPSKKGVHRAMLKLDPMKIVPRVSCQQQQQPPFKIEQTNSREDRSPYGRKSFLDLTPSTSLTLNLETRDIPAQARRGMPPTPGQVAWQDSHCLPGILLHDLIFLLDKVCGRML